MNPDEHASPSDERAAQARELLALVGEYTAEVAAFGRTLTPGADEGDLAERQRRLDVLRARIAALREQTLARRNPPPS